MGPTSSLLYSANGIRTRVWALRGPRPSPLDDSAKALPIRTAQARQDSNLQPPVLETGALPLELRTSAPIPPGTCPARGDRTSPVSSPTGPSQSGVPGWLTGIEPA